ncbi:hypothetical protein D5086_003472 [Populus alba]|uniref:Uncharacterized protein n=1 Tax=Populus alba TaxID=43335 RepID=A0ACC4D4D9_POPAL
MGDLQVIGETKKLNHTNYNTWSTCMMSYIQGQDLWEVVNGSETLQPEAENTNAMLTKWKIKHIRDVKTPKETWDTFAKLFSKKNDTRLQLLEIQGWENQPSLVEFENLLAGQEALAKQIGGASLRSEEEALYVHKGSGNFKQHGNGRFRRHNDKIKNHQEKEDDELALTAILSDQIEYDEPALIAALSDQIDYEKEDIVTTNNFKLPIAHVGNTMVSNHYSDNDISLQKVYHVPGPQDVRVYHSLEIVEEPLMKGQRLESVYVMFVETAYIDKTRKNEKADLYHLRLSHYEKAHQLPYEESKFKAKKPLELVHSDVFGPVKQASISGMQYMVTFIDDFSRKGDVTGFRFFAVCPASTGFRSKRSFR